MIFEGNKIKLERKKRYTERLKKNLRKSNLWVGESGVKYPSVLNLDQLRQSEFVDNAGKADTEQNNQNKEKAKKKKKSWGNY